jgi:hypothetical protein
MAINQINLPVRQPKRDALDRIAQGLQIAQSVFQIPVAYQQARAASAEADIKEDERQGIVTPGAALKAGVNLTPKQAAPALTPPEAGVPALTPPQISPLAPNSGQVVRVRGADGEVTEMQATSAKGREDALGASTGMRKEFLELAKPAITAAAGYKKVASAQPTPAGDLALVFGYSKVLDPMSSVREGEVMTIENARGIESGVRALYNKVLSGQKLDANQRADLKRQAAVQFNATLDSIAPVYADYKAKAGRLGIDAADALFDVESLRPPQEAPKQKAGPTPPAAKAAPDKPAVQSGPYKDAEKERRYQEWKAKQGKK